MTGAVSATPANPRTSLLTEPVDYQPRGGHRAALVGRTTLEIGYEIGLRRPRSLTGRTVARSRLGRRRRYPTASAQALPPDNVFHQVRAAGGYSLPYKTRISANGSFGWYRQNDDFLPYTVNPALAVTTPLPRGDAGGKIDATNLGLRITSRPLTKLRLSAGYRFDDRDNNTPRDVFIYVPGDSLPQDTITSNRARINLPNSYRLHEARRRGLRSLLATELSAARAQREKRNDRGRGDAGHRRSAPLAGRAWAAAPWTGVVERNAGEEAYAPRSSTASRPPVASLAGRAVRDAPGCASTSIRRGAAGRAARRSTRQRNDSADGGMDERRYPTRTGLKVAKVDAGLDGSWSPVDPLTTYPWYSYEQFRSEQDGRSWGALRAQAFDPSRDWEATDLDAVHTAGVGAEWSVIEDWLTLRVDYVASRAVDSIDVNVGPASGGRRAVPRRDDLLHDVGGRPGPIYDGLLRARRLLYEVPTWRTGERRLRPATIGEVLGLVAGESQLPREPRRAVLRYEFLRPRD